MIGNRLPSAEIVTEYAQADPTYVAKTQVEGSCTGRGRCLRCQELANTYEAYRRVKGDGQCGWRGKYSPRSCATLTPNTGTVFAYFEILLKSGDLGLLVQEDTRIRSYEVMMRSIGMDYDLLVDMFDSTFELLQSIRKSFENGSKDEAVIMSAFNDEIVSNSIVYHFKASKWSNIAPSADQVR
jgi:ubiquitin thioesterase protein OTUB1